VLHVGDETCGRAPRSAANDALGDVDVEAVDDGMERLLGVAEGAFDVGVVTAESTFL